jgi:hypothetical protein
MEFSVIEKIKRCQTQRACENAGCEILSAAKIDYPTENILIVGKALRPPSSMLSY